MLVMSCRFRLQHECVSAKYFKTTDGVGAYIDITRRGPYANDHEQLVELGILVT